MFILTVWITSSSDWLTNAEETFQDCQVAEGGKRDGSIPRILRERSTFQLSETIGKVCLIMMMSNSKAEIVALFLSLQGHTVLHLHRDRLDKLGRCRYSINGTHRLCIVRKFELSCDHCSNGYDTCARRLQGILWNVHPEAILLPHDTLWLPTDNADYLLINTSEMFWNKNDK